MKERKQEATRPARSSGLQKLCLWSFACAGHSLVLFTP